MVYRYFAVWLFFLDVDVLPMFGRLLLFRHLSRPILILDYDPRIFICRYSLLLGRRDMVLLAKNRFLVGEKTDTSAA